MIRFFLKPKRSLGQNFILSDTIAKKIVDLAGNLEDFNVIEIGPGRGILTREILKRNPGFLLAIEKDSSLISYYEHLLNKYKKSFQIIKADALQIKEEELIARPVKVIANLPYYISVALLLKWLKNIEIFKSLTLTFQKETVDRIIASPNSKNYGSLSLISQLLCNIKREFDIEPKEFSPRPKVYSSVITIEPLNTQRFAVNLKVLTRLTNAVFSQRRKTIRNSLLAVTKCVDAVLRTTQLSGKERPENLTIKQFCSLANAMEKYSSIVQ